MIINIYRHVTFPSITNQNLGNTSVVEVTSVTNKYSVRRSTVIYWPIFSNDITLPTEILLIFFHTQEMACKYLPCLAACKRPWTSSRRQASKAHATTASFFLPEIVTSAISGSPLGPSTGNLHQMIKQNLLYLLAINDLGYHLKTKQITVFS